MKKVLLLFLLILDLLCASAQRGYNYYKDSTKNGSSNPKAFSYFKKAYYDCIWKWTTAGTDSAEYYLKLAIQEDTNYVAAYAFLAHLYQFRTYNPQDFDKYFVLQKKYAQKAMSYHPATGDTYSVMSDVVWSEHDTVQALNLLRSAIAREPDNVGNYLFLSVRFTQIGGNDDSAVYYLHKLLQYDPEYGQAFIKLGNIYNWNIHNFDSAAFYYRQGIQNYNTIQPRDNRMMYGYFGLADVYHKLQQYDSAIYYYRMYLHELEPSDMYVRAQFLVLTYKAIYECQQRLSGEYLNKFLTLNVQRITSDPNNIDLLMETLEQNYMGVDQDSVYEKYALPLATRIQKMHNDDPYLAFYAIDDQYKILVRLKRNKEAMKLLEAQIAKHPKDPLLLFDLGRLKIAMNDSKAGLVYLNKAKLYLNKDLSKQGFIDGLKEKDFDRIRNTIAFRKLIE